MILIPTIFIDSILKPSEPIPATAIKIVCDGTNYTVYEDSDELPVIE
jgi:hypothetical protein